jgi:hypothetical protein
MNGRRKSAVTGPDTLHLSGRASSLGLRLGLCSRNEAFVLAISQAQYKQRLAKLYYCTRPIFSRWFCTADDGIFPQTKNIQMFFDKRVAPSFLFLFRSSVYMYSAYSRIKPAIANLFQMFRRKRHYRQHRFSIILPHYFSN